MKKLIAILAALVFAGSAHADAPNSRFKLGYGGYEYKNNPDLPKPAYLTTVQDPAWGVKVTRVGGDVGALIPGYTGADSVWGRDSRHHYQKDPVWNYGESFMWIENGRRSTVSNYGPETKVTKLILSGSTYAVDWARSHSRVFRDSMTEMRWHPTESNVAYVLYSDSKAPAGKTKIVLWDSYRDKILRSWLIPDDPTNGPFEWQGEGNVSDNGRFTAMATFPANASASVTVLVIDFFNGTSGSDTSGSGGLGSWDTTVVAPHPTQIFTGPQIIDHVNISPLGNYVVFKYNEGGSTSRFPQDQMRVMNRGLTPGTLDTTSKKVRPQTMREAAPRFAVVDSVYDAGVAAGDNTLARDGWIYPLSHPCMNVDSTGAEVIVGGGRGRTYRNNMAADWNGKLTHDHAERDSGKVVAIELSTGLHWHVSPGRRVADIGGSEEALSKHHSAEATQLRGWVCVWYEEPVTGGAKRFENEVVMVKLTRSQASRSIWRFGPTRTAHAGTSQDAECANSSCAPAECCCYRQESHPVPSPTGTRVIFASNWRYFYGTTRGTCDEAKSYVLDARAPAHMDYYVADNGNDSNNGLTPAYPWATIEKANATVVATKYNVRVNVGTRGAPYTATPSPAAAPDSGFRYSFVGRVDDPTLVAIQPAVAPATIDQSYVTVKGMHFKNGLTVGGVRRDSVADVKITGPFDINGAEDCMFTRITHTGRFLRFGVLGTKRRTVRDTLTNIRSILSVIEAETNESPAFQFGAANADPAERHTVDSCIVERSRFEVYVASTAKVRTNPNNTYDTSTRPTSIAAVRLYNTRNFLSRYNQWYLRSAQPSHPVALAISDSSTTVAFNGDSLLAHGERGDVILHSSGSVVTGVSVDSSYFSTARGIPALFAAQAVNASLTYSTFASGSAQALLLYGASGCTIDHNTFFSAGPGNHGVVYFGGGPWGATDTTKFYNNILHLPAFRGDAPPMSAADTRCGLFWQEHAMLPTAAFKSNWNLYSIFGYHRAEKDGAIGWCCNYASNPPGAGGVNWRALFPPARRIDGDSLSTYGGAEFDYGGPDTTFVQFPTETDSIFNSTPSQYSAAIGTGKSGSTIGARGGLVLPIMELAATNVRFYPTQVGVTLTAFIAISNAGTGTLEITNVASGSAEVSPVLSGDSISAGLTEQFTITLTPTVLTARTFTFTFATNDPNNPLVTVTVFQNGHSEGGTQEYPSGDL